MKKNNMLKKGFTLIELLAVIILLAVIALIATPIILGIISDTKKNSFKDTAYGITQATRNAYVEMMYAGAGTNLKNVTYFYNNGVASSSPAGYTLKFEGAKPQNGKIFLNTEGKVSLLLYDGKYCATKDYADVEITITETTLDECIPPLVDDSGANVPVLTTGLSPVTWNGSNWIIASNIDDPYHQNWYDYGEKKWANAITFDPTRTLDYSGTNHYGIKYNITSQADSLYFNGTTSSYIDVNGLENYNFGSNITLATRFKIHKLNTYQDIFGNWESGGGGIAITADNHISCELSITGYKYANSTTVVQNNTYYSVACTYDGSNLKLYVNGSLEATTPVTGSITLAAKSYTIGGNPESGYVASPCQASISDILIYSRALTPTEITTNLAGQFNAPSGSVLLNYRLSPSLAIPTGTAIPISNINTMWVWIPRYIYKITSDWHTSSAGALTAQFSQGTDDNWNSGVIGAIDTGTTASASNNKWTNLPSFKFGTTELTGMWVAKFEVSTVEGVANGYRTDQGCPTAGDNVSTKTIKIIPSAISWRCIQVGNAFTASRNMETNSYYGWGTSGDGIDTHLMKNSEWGAVTYLYKSQYGLNGTAMYGNNSQTYQTGCTGNTATEALYNGCRNAYSTANGVKASTTGNIYGVYDMAGGAWDTMSAYISNGTANLNNYGSNIVSANGKYKDVYTITTDTMQNNFNSAANQKGDSIYETATGDASAQYPWTSKYSNMPNGTEPWFLRGEFAQYCGNASPYVFFKYYGGGSGNMSFRPTLVIGTGL